MADHDGLLTTKDLAEYAADVPALSTTLHSASGLWQLAINPLPIGGVVLAAMLKLRYARP